MFFVYFSFFLFFDSIILIFSCISSRSSKSNSLYVVICFSMRFHLIDCAVAFYSLYSSSIYLLFFLLLLNVDVKKEKFWIGNWTNNSKKFKSHLNNHYLTVFYSFYGESSMLLRRIVRIDEIGTIICYLVDFNEKKTEKKHSLVKVEIHWKLTFIPHIEEFPYFLLLP